MDLVRERLDHPFQECRPGGSSGRLHQRHNGEFAGSINGDIEVELAFGGLDLGDIDVEIADRICLEPLLGGLGGRDLWQPRDAATNAADAGSLAEAHKGNRPAAEAYAGERRQ